LLADPFSYAYNNRWRHKEHKRAVSLPVASNGVKERNARWRKELGQKCGIQNEREPEDTDDDERDAPAEKLLRCYERPPR
jgi:hypothetical protein